MNEEKKKQIATFRFKVIADLVGDVCLEKGQLEKLIQQKANRKWEIPYSQNTTLSPGTIRRWIHTYNAQNGDIKEEFPGMGVPELLYEMQQRKLIDSVHDLKQTTVYRFFHQNGGLKKLPAKIDRRRFEAEFPNDLWQSDVMHGPKVKIDGKTKKTYLIAFIDDHSRLVPHAAFYENEQVNSFVRAINTALIHRGLPRKLYTDNGSAFRSKQLEFAMASLQISLIHARPYSPQGKGKIERFFKTVRSGFLTRGFPDDLDELNATFRDWLENRYHRSVHSSTGETPLTRFTKNIELIREAPEDLCDHFRTVDLRTVTKDRIVHLNGSLYEAPIDLIGERVEVVHFPGYPESIEIRFQGESYGYMEPLDLGVNFKVRRDKTGEELFLEEDEDVESSNPGDGQLFSDPEDDEFDLDNILF
jgi:putative transposase